MFGLFKKKSDIDLLYEKYNKLMADAHKLMAVNRKQSDAKYAEAQDIMDQIDELEKLK